MKRIYEGMILTDPNKAREDSEAVQKELHEIIERFQGSIINLENWEERKLSCEIRSPEGKHRRAAYFLTHFQVESSQIDRIERALSLSPNVFRSLIVRDEDGTDIVHIKDYEEISRPQDERGEGRRGGGGGGRRPASSGRPRRDR